MDQEAGNFSSSRRRPQPGLVVLIVLLHLLALYGLTRAFAPTLVASVEKTVVSAFTVTVTTPQDPEPEPDPGAAGEQGKEAVPKPVTAPPAKLQVPKNTPVPRASSTGAANTSGAKDSGDGTGAGDTGSGTGSGNGGGGQGGGQGGGIAVKPSVRSGELNQARDFPVPPGGRETRFGKSVTVLFTVTTEGRARDCSVASSQVDAETTARVCPLVMEKVRFNPATRTDGTAVEARYGYRVDFKPL